MTDKSSTNSDMEEYKLQEESNVHQEYDVQDLLSSKETIIEKIKNWRGRRLLIPIVLIVSIVSVYQFLSWHSNRKEQSVKQEEIVAKKQAYSDTATLRPELVGPQQQVGSGVAKKEAFPGIVDQGVAANIVLQQKLDALTSKIDGNADQLQKVQVIIAQEQATLVDLNQTVDGLSKSVQELNSNVQSVVSSMNSKSKGKKVVKKEVVASPLAVYHVRAIVPGLAWLEASSGKIVAVRVGDELEGCGKISLISPKQGMVVTSSGAIIQYGVNDF